MSVSFIIIVVKIVHNQFPIDRMAILPPFFAAITDNSMNIFEHLCEGCIVNIKQIPVGELLGQSIYAWPILIDTSKLPFKEGISTSESHQWASGS